MNQYAPTRRILLDISVVPVDEVGNKYDIRQGCLG